MSAGRMELNVRTTFRLEIEKATFNQESEVR